MASKMSSEGDGGIIADINVTPFVDITLVLLIIFMVAVPMIMNQAIKVNLPKAASGKSAETTTVAITIKRDGKVYLNGNLTDRRRLTLFLRAEARANKKLRAIVSADQEVTHGTVVSYLDLLNLTGISRYAVSVEKPPEAEGR
jgi:biopolymer transport protein ExbD